MRTHRRPSVAPTRVRHLVREAGAFRLALAFFLLAAPGAVAEKWKGSIELPGGQALAFTATLETAADGSTTATIDIPAQGALGLPLADVVRTEETLAFSIPGAGADFEFALSDGGRAGSGTLKQHGLTLPGTVEKMSEAEAVAAAPKRPQEPRPPFPYQQWEVRYRNASDGTRLAGTLTVPEGDGPFPAAVLITGSGPQDRDEALMGHRPFAVIADHLSRRGIAVLRSDDRGVGGSEGHVATATPADTAGDVAAAVKFLRGLETIDSDRIGLIGHSEGGIIAPLVAAKDRRIAYLVLLAGPGVPGSEILPEQLGALLRAAGLPEPMVERQLEAQGRLLTAIAADAPRDELRALVRQLAGQQLPGGPDSVSDAMVEGQLAQVTTPWFRSFLELDPAVALRKVRAPVLALNGGKDLQVVASQNVPALRAALEGNERAVVAELPGLNHLFQHAETGGVDEYAQIEETMAPEVLDRIEAFIRSAVAASRG